MKLIKCNVWWKQSSSGSTQRRALAHWSLHWKQRHSEILQFYQLHFVYLHVITVPLEWNMFFPATFLQALFRQVTTMCHLDTFYMLNDGKNHNRDYFVQYSDHVSYHNHWNHHAFTPLNHLCDYYRADRWGQRRTTMHALSETYGQFRVTN